MVATIITITVVLILLYVLFSILEAKKAKKANQWTFSGDTRLQKRKYGLAMDLYGAMNVGGDPAVLPTCRVYDAIVDGVVYQFLNEDDRMEAHHGGFAQERLEDKLLDAMWNNEFLVDGKPVTNVTHVVETLFEYCYPKG